MKGRQVKFSVHCLRALENHEGTKMFGKMNTLVWGSVWGRVRLGKGRVHKKASKTLGLWH